MSDVHCPHCGIELKRHQVKIGWCNSCKNWLPESLKQQLPQQPEITPKAIETTPKAIETKDSGKGSTLGKVLLGILSLAFLIAYPFLRESTSENIEIVVNNGEYETVRVYLDNNEDKEVLKVDPKQVGRFKCSSGKHRIVVRGGHRTIYDQTKDIQRRGSESRKYLLDTAKRDRYCVQSVKYSISKISFIVVDDYSEGAELQELLKNVKPAPKTEWIDEDSAFILEPPAKNISSKGYKDAKRNRIVKISQAEYDLISNPPKGRAFTDQQRAALKSLTATLKVGL